MDFVAGPPYRPDFERFRNTLEGRPADRVPLFDFVMAHNVEEGFLGRRIAGDADEIEFWRSAGYDYVVASVAFPLNVPLSTATGGQIKWRNEHRGPIGSWEDFRLFPWPDPEDLDYASLERLGRLMPSDMRIVTVAGNFYAKAQELLGFESLSLLLYDEPTLVEAVFERLADLTYAVLERVTRIPGVGGVVSGGDIAYDGGTFLDPEVLRRLVFPRYHRVTSLCHERSMPVVHHSDGDLTLVMEDLIRAGFDGFHPFEPKAMDIVAVKRRWGRRICILGNVDVDLLARGSPESIGAEVRRKIRELSPGGRYCVGSSNSIAPYIPVDNFRAMVQAAWEHGG